MNRSKLAVVDPGDQHVLERAAREAEMRPHQLRRIRERRNVLIEAERRAMKLAEAVDEKRADLLEQRVLARRRVVGDMGKSAQHPIDDDEDELLLAVGDLVQRSTRATQSRCERSNGEVAEAFGENDGFEAVEDLEVTRPDGL